MPDGIRELPLCHWPESFAPGALAERGAFTFGTAAVVHDGDRFPERPDASGMRT